MNEEYTFHPAPDQKTGRYTITCPKCSVTVHAYTSDGVARAICDHLNERHTSTWGH